MTRIAASVNKYGGVRDGDKKRPLAGGQKKMTPILYHKEVWQ